MKLRVSMVNILLLTLTACISLICAEWIYRVFADNGDKARVYHPIFGEINPPNQEWKIHTSDYTTIIRTNSAGFRGPEFPMHKADDELRILFVGDSFLEAKQVSEAERFSHQVQNKLGKLLRRPVTSIALGIGGASPLEELLYYQHIGRSLQPDVVVQVLFPENDVLINSDLFHIDHGTEGQLILSNITAPQKQTCSWKCQILLHSKLICKTYQMLRNVSTQLPLADRMREFYWYTKSGLQQLQEEKGIDTLTLLVSTLRNEVVADGGIYLAILIPSFFEIQSTWRAEVQKEYPEVEHNEWDVAGLLDTVLQSLRAENINVFDMRPVLRNVSNINTNTLYYRSDPHLSLRAHDIIAPIIVDKIQQNLVLF